MSILARALGGGRFVARACLSVLLLVVALDSHAADDAAFRSPMLVLEHAGRRIELSAEQIAALPQHRITTSTNWMTGVHEFEGPLARDVLAMLDLGLEQPRTLRLHAWDEYLLEVSSADYYRWDVILALRMDGRLLTLAEFGPLCVVYPRDQNPELFDSRYNHRWVWMLKGIEVLEK